MLLEICLLTQHICVREVNKGTSFPVENCRIRITGIHPVPKSTDHRLHIGPKTQKIYFYIRSTFEIMIVIKVYLHFAFTSFHIELAKQQKVKNLSSTVSTLPSSFVFSLNCKKRKVEKRKLKRYVYLSYIDNHRKIHYILWLASLFTFFVAQTWGYFLISYFLQKLVKKGTISLRKLQYYKM